MKNALILLGILAFSSLFLACGDDCGSDVSITSVSPSANLAAHEVLIKTSGFSTAATVVFGNVAATEKRTTSTAGEIIARVPAGLAGDVEISVSEGECIARADFSALSSYPNGAQPWLPDLVVPSPPTNFPANDINNFWKNAAASDNDSYGLRLWGDFVNGRVTLHFDSNDPSNDEQSFEFDFRDPNSPLHRNPITGWADKWKNEVKLTIDRTARGYGKEAFEGEFIEPPAWSPAFTSHAILLTSQVTGSQLVVFF